MSDYFVGSEGNVNASIACVLEKPATEEVAIGRPAIGPTGSMFRGHLRRAGLDPGSRCDETCGGWPCEKHIAKDVYITNSVQHFDDASANPTNEDVIREQPRLFRELSEMPNLKVIIAVGNHAMASLGNFRYTGFNKAGEPTGIMDWRGSVVPTVLHSRVSPNPNTPIKMVPTLHPSFYVRGEWRYKNIVQFDIERAVEESSFYEIRRDEREFYISPNYEEALEWLAILKSSQSGYMSFDIETVKGLGGSWYITCIAFSDQQGRAFCFPFMHNDRTPWWTLEQEMEIRKRMQELFLLPNTIYITQNGLFDCWHLRREGFITPYMINGHDTMYSHRLIAADLPHDLGFINSIYTNEPYYKGESGSWEKNISVPENQFFIYNCLSAETPILKNDLTWKTLADIKIGDKLLSFEENSSGYRYARKFVECEVIKTASSKKKVLRVALENGELIGTPDHKVYDATSNSWKRIDELTTHSTLVYTASSRDVDSSYEAGWLAGIMDGEGCVEKRKVIDDATYVTLQIAQNPGITYNEIIQLLEMYKTTGTAHRSSYSKTHALSLKGGLSETIRLLSLVRPKRLIDNFINIVRETGVGGFAHLPRKKVLYIKDAGEKIVVDITTTSGTFIADGYLVHNCKDSCQTLEIAIKERTEMREFGIYEYYMRVMQAQYKVLLNMRIRGMKIDRKRLHFLRDQALQIIADNQNKIQAIAGFVPNTKSYIEMGKFLIGVLHITGAQYTSGGKTGIPRIKTSEEILRTYAYNNPHARDAIMASVYITQQRTLLSNFLRPALDPNDFYHPGYDLSHAKSGRLSSQGADEGGFQAQNLPVSMRTMIIADDGESILTQADLKQAEAMNVAWLAEDPFLIAAFKQKLDMHRIRGCQIFRGWRSEDGLPPLELMATITEVCPLCQVKGEKKCSHSERFIAKMSGHAFNYKMSVNKFVTIVLPGVDLFISFEEGARIRRAVLSYHVLKWQTEMENRLRESPILRGPLGRVREFYGILNDDMVREALAWESSHIVSDITNPAMITLEETLPYPARIVTQTHDSCLVSHKKNQAKEVYKRLDEAFYRPIMIHGRELIIPLDIHSAENWGAMA